MDVHRIVGLARIYSEMPWKEWGSSDLAEIHSMLTALSTKYPIKYTIEVLQDKPTEVVEV